MIEEDIRNTKSLGDGTRLYSDAKIDIQELDYRDVSPIALYVMRPSISYLLRMMKELDIFNLTEVVESNGAIIAPPIVEHADGGLSIVDGIHRFFLASLLDRKVKTVVVEGAHPDYPLIGMPVQWEQVVVCDNPPTFAAQRRVLRPGVEPESPRLKNLYRDFSYLGSLGRRPLKV